MHFDSLVVLVLGYGFRIYGLCLYCVMLCMCKCYIYIYIYNITFYNRNESEHFLTRGNNVQFLKYLSPKTFVFLTLAITLLTLLWMLSTLILAMEYFYITP